MYTYVIVLNESRVFRRRIFKIAKREEITTYTRFRINIRKNNLTPERIKTIFLL